MEYRKGMAVIVVVSPEKFEPYMMGLPQRTIRFMRSNRMPLVVTGTLESVPDKYDDATVILRKVYAGSRRILVNMRGTPYEGMRARINADYMRMRNY